MSKDKNVENIENISLVEEKPFIYLFHWKSPYSHIKNYTNNKDVILWVRVRVGFFLLIFLLFDIFTFRCFHISTFVFFGICIFYIFTFDFFFDIINFRPFQLSSFLLSTLLGVIKKIPSLRFITYLKRIMLFLR